MFFLLYLSFLFGCKEKVNLSQSREVVFAKENQFVIGDGWTRKTVSQNTFENESDQHRKVFNAVARIKTSYGSGTAFYLGQYEGEYLFATNFHVLPDKSLCNSRTHINLRKFDSLNCKKLIAAWSSHDISFFTVGSNYFTEKNLDRREALEFDFDDSFTKNDQLLLAGFGRYKNHKRLLTYIDDEFCKVVSEPGIYKELDGPDIISLEGKKIGKKKTWSLMHACEGSYGDSGAPLYNLDSGKVIGINWGGKDPKGKRFQFSHYVRTVIDQQKEKAIWSTFNMAVPASKIAQKIKISLDSNEIKDPLSREILRSFISNAF